MCMQEYTSELLERGSNLLMHWCRSYFFQVTDPLYLHITTITTTITITITAFSQ